MAKKIKNPELLVAEIHTLQSKYRSLQSQYQANEEKLKRLSSTNNQIKKAATEKKNRLEELMKKAQANGIQF